MSAVDRVEEAGFKGLEAGNADQALAILRGGEPIGSLFTDVDMPGSMDGRPRPELAVYPTRRARLRCAWWRSAPGIQNE